LREVPANQERVAGAAELAVRLLVCGGRTYGLHNLDEAATLYAALSAIHEATPITAIIEGGARGADCLAREWGREHGVKVVTVPADWATHGKAAGPIRNQRMIDDFKPDLVLAFAGGKGTSDMVRRAERAGIAVKWCGVA
jgi:hypothetical protein